MAGEQNGDSDKGFEGYAGFMELELHEGQKVRCQVPTFAQGVELLALRRRVYQGDDDALELLVKRFPEILGLTEQFNATPLLPAEFLEIVNRFFVHPARLAMRDPARAPAPGSQPSTMS